MSYYLTKAVIVENDKNVKKQFAVKASSSVLAEALTSANLSDDEVLGIPDINIKNWSDIIINETGGYFFDIMTCWTNIDDKSIKTPYLIQALDFDGALSKVKSINVGVNNFRVLNIKETPIINYFEEI